MGVLSQDPSNSKACEKHNSHHVVLLTSALCLEEIPELVHSEGRIGIILCLPRME